MDATKGIEAAFEAEFICYEFPSERQRDTAMTMFRLGYRAASKAREAELAEAGLKYVSLFGELQGAMEEIARKTEALETIASWRLPETSEVWPSGNRVSYEGAYGSNGARDYMRKVARAALTTTPQPTE